MTGLGPDAVMPILLNTLAASMDHDTDRLAEVTKPLYLDGDDADRYGFLCGLLAVIKGNLPCGGPAPGSFARLEIADDAEPQEVAYGRLLTAYINDGTCMDLWAAVIRDAELEAATTAIAIHHAGHAMLARTGTGQ